MARVRRAIGIVRVSVVGGREGESFASPAEQRDRIEAACKAEGIRLTAVHEELDVSGGRPLEQRHGLRAAIEAVEAKQADVVIAAYLDRLCRSLDVQRELVERVEAAGGEVRALDVGAVSHATATTKLSATLLGAFAEYQRDRARENARASHTRAVARGVPPWPNIIPGYRRGPDEVLVPYPPEVEPIREAFRMRAHGAPIAKVREYLAGQGIKRSEHGVSSLIESRVVLGELVFGELRNPVAHEAIVDRETWKRAQEATVPRGRMAPSSALLARLGVLRCGECGGRMTVGTNRNGIYPAYRCPGKSEADCPARFSISATFAEQAIVAATRAAICNSSIRSARKFLQSNQIFSCSLPCKCSTSDASSSNARSNSPPRSSNKTESGPANSTRISGCSHSRFCAIGGSTVIRYFSLKPPFEMTACRNSPICFAAATLSVIGISKFSAVSYQLSVFKRRRIEPRRGEPA